MYDLEHCILYPAVKDGDNLLSETGDERHIGTLGPILWDKNGEKHVALTAGHSLQPCQTDVFIRKSFEPDDAVEVFVVSRGSVRVPIDRPTGLQDITEEEHYSRLFVRIREPANFMDDYYALLVPSTVIVDTISRNTNFYAYDPDASALTADEISDPLTEDRFSALTRALKECLVRVFKLGASISLTMGILSAVQRSAPPALYESISKKYISNVKFWWRHQCCQPSRPSWARTERRRLFEAGLGRTEGRPSTEKS